jgi:hypothetical protein
MSYWVKTSRENDRYQQGMWFEAMLCDINIEIDAAV